MHYTILRLAKGGFGISNETGKTFFVDGGLPGESGEAEVTEEKDRFGRCTPLTRTNDSEYRAPLDNCPCTHECDGCGFRHVRPECALALKASAIYAEILKSAHLADIPYDLAPLSNNALDYTRKRIRIHVEHGKLGYFARNSHSIISASKCVIISKELQNAVSWLEQNFPHIDGARLDIQIDLDCHNRPFAHIKSIEPRILKKHQHRPGIQKSLPKPPSFDLNKLSAFAQTAISSGPFSGIRLGDKSFGIPWICDEVEVSGLKTTSWRRIGDFAQATAEANAHIHKLIDEFLIQTTPSFAADLYAGSGNLTFRAATRVPHVEGYEFFCDINAFEKGKKDNTPVFMPNASVNLTQIDLSKGLPKSAMKADVLICDPARDGLSERIAQDICQSNAKEILYVSCEASCLARDLARLKNDFSVLKLTFVDMFPQTPHVETVARLTRIPHNQTHGIPSAESDNSIR